nr:MAG TPA: hypothetical protein [Herelleviridae sp.]
MHNAFSFRKFDPVGSIGYYPSILPDETSYFDWKRKENSIITSTKTDKQRHSNTDLYLMHL